MLASTVVTSVRKRLGDINEDRWDNDTLLLYLSLAQNDLAMFTKLYRKVDKLQIKDAVLTYKLPSDCLAITRLEYNNQFFPIYTHNDIDKGKAVIPCAIQDSIPFGYLDLYIGITSKELLSMLLAEQYGVVSDSDDGTETGGIDTSSCVLENKDGVTSYSWPDVEECPLDDKYGVVTEVSDVAGVDYSLLDMVIFYAATPPIVTSLDEELVFPDIWLSAFIHYVCGMALQDDNDANNIQRGEMELQKYDRVMKNIYKLVSKDFSTNYKSKLSVDYRRI